MEIYQNVAKSTYSPISKFPSVERDLCFKVSLETKYQEIIDAIKNFQKQLDEKKQSGIGTYVTEERKRDEWQNLFDFLDRTLNDIKTNEADEKIRSRMN